MLGWFGFKAVADFCNCGSHVGALAGALDGWHLLWKADLVAGAMDGALVGTMVLRLVDPMRWQVLRLELWWVSPKVQWRCNWLELWLVLLPLLVHVVVVVNVLTLQSTSVETVELNWTGGNCV